MKKGVMMICILGSGIAGLAIARDLTMRGLECVVIERNYIGSGTSTRCAGMLHSGARYAFKSKEIASQCMIENRLIKDLMPFAVASDKGLYVVLKGDEAYSEQFEQGCKESNIPIESLSPKEALALEPNINPGLIRVYLTNDGTINPYLLIESHLEYLQRENVKIFENQIIFDVKRAGNKWCIRTSNQFTGTVSTFNADIVVNATGPSSASVAKLFGADLSLLHLHGAILVFEKKLVNSLVTRCAPSSVGDVVAASGERCLAAATSNQYPCSEFLIPCDLDKREILQNASQLVPGIKFTSIVHAFSGIRVHISSRNNAGISGFNVPREYAVFDHQENQSIPGLITVLGGKLILFRHVAEVAGDLIASRCGCKNQSTTRTVPLESPENFTGRFLCQLPEEAELIGSIRNNSY